jgi:death-on-curing protein
VRDLGRVQAALAQPASTFDGVELYPTIVAKAAALGFSLIQGHPFVDGNKRIGHAAMEVFLILNGLAVEGSVDEQEGVVLQVASGQLSREGFERARRLSPVNWFQSFTRGALPERR